MANDYKRMWTKEELEQISPKAVVDMEDVPENVTASSPDFIRVQGKLYYKHEDNSIKDLTGTTWYWNEQPNTAETSPSYKINFKSGSYDEYGIKIVSALDSEHDYPMILYTINYGGKLMEIQAFGMTSWNGDEYRRIEIINGDDVTNKSLINYLTLNATLLVGNSSVGYTYSEIGGDEELVKSIPTAVSIIEDQGKLELMLEHDGNVLAVNDTPNQFLQRRLDKPSKTYNIGVNSLNNDIKVENIDYNTLKVGQFVCLWLTAFDDDGGKPFYGIVYNALGDRVHCSCIPSYWGTNDDDFYIYEFRLNANSIDIFGIIGDVNHTITSADVTMNDNLKLEVF